MNGIHRKALALSAAALVLASAAWILWRAPQANNAGVANPQPVQTAEPAAGTAVDASPPELPPAPLPPANAPIAAIAATLQQRADAGDSLAACRLGIELIRCRQVMHHESNRPFLAKRMERAEKEGELAYAEALRQRDADYTRLALSCADLPAGLRERGGAYLRQAARASEPEAMLRYADGQAFDVRDGYAYLSSPDFDTWRREAPAMLQRALAMGRPEAVHLLHAAYGSDDGLLSSLVPNDPETARAYQILAVRMQGAGGPRLHGRFDVVKPTPEQWRRAMELSTEWHQRHFGGRRIDAARALDGLAPLHDPLGSSNIRGEPAAFCDRAGNAFRD